MASYDGLRPGQVAAAVGVNLQTMRYYERRGLLQDPGRSLGGHRLYSEEAITVLRVIKTAQRLDFTLDEVADLLDTPGTDTSPAMPADSDSGPNRSSPPWSAGSPTWN